MWTNIYEFYNFMVFSRVYSTYYFYKANFLPLYFSKYLFYLGVVLGGVILCISYYRFKFNLKWGLIAYFLFFFVVYGLTTSTSLFIFFLFYELLFFCSFLLVYYVSPNRRSIFASLYFFFWTQCGSLLVAIGFLYLYFSGGVVSFSDFLLSDVSLNSFEIISVTVLLFLGFGIKIPIWPFYYWLTKTHVEAPTFFSIYLSGFLVKTALYGLYMCYIYLPWVSLSYIYLGVIIFGVYDSTLKMWAQVDLKKLVAYGTVQEMNGITLLFLLGGVNSLKLGVLFCITHTLLSSLFFFLVDLLYRMYKTRNKNTLSGLFTLNPELSWLIIISVVLYTGLPFTLKFIVEFGLFFTFTSVSWWLVVFLLISLQFFGGIIWINSWVGILYGQPNKSTPYITNVSIGDKVFFNTIFLQLILFPVISFF